MDDVMFPIAEFSHDGVQKSDIPNLLIDSRRWKHEDIWQKKATDDSMNLFLNLRKKHKSNYSRPADSEIS